MTWGRGRGFGFDTGAVVSIAVDLLTPRDGDEILCS
jgi:hypothetical protein